MCTSAGWRTGPGALVSAHITRDAASGAVVLADSASHTADYRLVDYTLHANQLGQSGEIHVDGAQVSFRLVDGARNDSGRRRPAILWSWGRR